jgi:hypothetical protein
MSSNVVPKLRVIAGTRSSPGEVYSAGSLYAVTPGRTQRLLQ